MSIQSWQSIIENIRNGEPVTAEVANRAINQLVQRTEHLKDRQDAQSLASAIFISGAPLTDDVKTGHAVYFNTIANKFAPAYADMVYKDGYLALSETSTVAGIVVYKDTTNSGVIVVEGMVDPSEYIALDCTHEDITVNMLVNSDDKGVLYLSSGSYNAGQLISKPGLLNVPVCTLLDSNHLLVRPPITSPLDTQALRFQLAARPATPELVLFCVSGTSYTVFGAGATSTFLVGNQVEVYSSNWSTPNTVNTVYLTGTVHTINQGTGTFGNPGFVAGQVWLKDVVLTKDAMLLLNSNNADHSLVFKPVAGQNLTMRNVGAATGYVISQGANSTTPPTVSSYVSVIDESSPSTGYAIKTAYVDAKLPGWLPATSQYFPSSSIPSGAKYGYNFDADPVLQQLFPETVVGTYVIYKDGAAVPGNTVMAGSNGVWWMDSFNMLPWHKTNGKHVLPDTNVKFSDWNLNTASGIVQPTNLFLAYTKLVSGGIKVVTSLETTEDSPLLITDPFGKAATSGPLVIKAGFNVVDASTTEPGSLVVKDVTGFNMKRGRVVERILAGTNVSLESSIAGGQGEVLVSVVGLDGKLEGQPDILTIDDVLVEKESSTNIFYSSMPPSKNSSILGKVDVPAYLEGSYKINLVITFLALHSSGAVAPPTLSLSWINMAAPGSNVKYNLASGSNAPTSGDLSGGLVPYAGTISPKDYFIKTVELATVSPGGEVFFRLARSSSDTYPGKLGIISLRYKFVKTV